MSTSTQKIRVSPIVRWKKIISLTLAGGAAFWLANFAISRTTIAAEYRAAMSISYIPMLLESLIGGLVFGFFISFLLVRFFDRIPTRNTMSKSIILSTLLLVIVTGSLGSPSSFNATNNVLRYFLISTVFNTLRITALGLAIGIFYQKSKSIPTDLLLASRRENGIHS